MLDFGLSNEAVPDAAETSPTENRGSSGLPQSLAGVVEKRKRGRPPGSKTGSGIKRNPGAHTPAAAGGAAAVPAQPMFTPDNVRPLVSLPFNLACARTGWEGWLLSEGEAQTLSASGTVVLNTWVTIDPRYVSLALFSLALISITAEKALLFSRALRTANPDQTPANTGAE